MTQSGRPSIDQVAGCLMGGAVADAVGYQVEFDKLDQILARRGPRGVTGPESGLPLLASDDTQMSLFTVEGLVRGADRLLRTPEGSLVFDETALAELTSSVRDAYLDWFDTQYPGRTRPLAGRLATLDRMRRRRAPGNTCLAALTMGAWGSPGSPINDSKGCGGVMRSAAVGLLPGSSLEYVFDLGSRTGALTHGHVEGWTSAGAMAVIVRMMWDETSGNPGQSSRSGRARLESAAFLAADMAEAHAGTITARLLRRAVASAHGPALTPGQLVAELGEGWTGDEALAVAVYAATAGGDFQDAVRIGATHCGDSDSTASIAGQILGARDGLACVPAGWIALLDLADIVHEQAGQFCTTFCNETTHAGAASLAGMASCDAPARERLPFWRSLFSLDMAPKPDGPTG